jgi:hypothetical protein
MSKYGLATFFWFSICIAWGTLSVIDKPQVLSRGSSEDGRYVDIESTAYLLDRVYLSMQGPRSNQSQLRLDLDSRDADTIWLTGIETTNVDADTGNEISDEYFCHSNLTFSPKSTTPEDHNAAFHAKKHMEWRLFTLVPGRMQLKLPRGFGIPIRGETQFDYFTMALNQNAGPERRTRMRTRIVYQRDGEGPMRPLFRRGLYVYQQHVKSNGVSRPRSRQLQHQGEFCSASCKLDLTSESFSTFRSVHSNWMLDQHPGAKCCVTNASSDGVTEQFGAENTVHWMVPPGKHEYHTEVTKQLQLPFDTSIHYVTGHLHPYGESLTLINLDSGEMVFEITSQDYDDRKGVYRMSEIQSIQGVPMRRDGRYELVAKYHNSTNEDVDAMGILYFYALDADPSEADALAGQTIPQGI